MIPGIRRWNLCAPVNAFNAAVTKDSHTPDYSAGNFLGYIYYKNDCNGVNPTMPDWNVTTSLTCNPTGSLTYNA